jgi:hypothetical protein
MELNKIKQRLELALKPAKPPTLEEVLEEVSIRGVLRGPVDWVFPAWMLYVEYATQKIAEAFQLTEEEMSMLLNFLDVVKTLLVKAQRQAREKLAALYKAVAEGNYRLEGGKLFAPDGTWMYATKNVMRVLLHRVSASAQFPDVLKLPRERLELLQLGWRASDEGNEKGRPFMATTQPWQMFAWAVTRYGMLYMYISSVNSTHQGISITMSMVARGWRQWRKEETINMVLTYLRQGELMPLLSMWLGDGKARWNRIGRFEVVIATKDPWKIGRATGDYEAVAAKGRDVFMRLAEVAGPYGELLDLLKAHKWIYIKEAIARKRSVDILREDILRDTAKNSRLEDLDLTSMKFSLVSGNGGTLIAAYYVNTAEEAVAAANALETLGMRPNVVKNKKYIVYIGLRDIKKNKQLREAAMRFLMEKMRSGTPKEREIVRRIIERNPDFSNDQP